MTAGTTYELMPMVFQVDEKLRSASIALGSDTTIALKVEPVDVNNTPDIIEPGEDG